MQEYWEITHARGIATLAVWQLQPAFALTQLTLAQHTTNVDGLPTTAQTRAAKEADLSDAREHRDDLFAKIAELNIRVPGIIDGKLTADDDLHGQLDLIYAEDSTDSQAAALRRGRLVAGLWNDFDVQQLAAVPPLPALTLMYATPGSDDPPVSVDQADFNDFVNDGPADQKAVEDARRALNGAKTALRSLESKVDRDNKRWYQAWTKLYPEGTPEGDAARSQIPTEQGTSAPSPLEIDTVSINPDRTALVTYAADGGEHATTLELQWKLEADGDFGHSTPITRPSQTVGPFPAATTVTFRTRLANSTPGVVLSQPKAAVVP